jgi:hypothetical protein
MFARELDIFNEINLTYILERYYDLESAIKERLKYEESITPYELFEKSTHTELYCITTIDKLTGKIVFFSNSGNRGGGRIFMNVVRINSNILELVKYWINNLILTDFLNEKYTHIITKDFLDEYEISIITNRPDSKEFINSGVCDDHFVIPRHVR